MAFPDTWNLSNKFLMTITPEGGNDIEAVGFTEGMSVSFGDKDVEQIVLNNNGRLAKFNPMDITEITFKEYTVGVASPNSLLGLWANGDATATSTSVTETRKKVRVALLWTTDTSATSAAGSTATDTTSFRMVFKDAYIVSAKPSFDDKILASDLTIKVIPFDKSGNANISMEEDDGTGLSALGSY